MEKTSPPMVPAAKANQNGSELPSNTNGTKPKMVETSVNSIGMILWL